MIKVLIGALCGAVLTLIGAYIWVVWYFSRNRP